MKIIFSENVPLYDQYLFPYSVYGQIEKKDSLDKVYANGFLPTRIQKDLFYLARGARIELKDFKASSENRRVERKTEDISVELHALQDFEYDFNIGKLAKDFYDNKSGNGTMSAQKMKWLFTSGAMSHVLVYKEGKEIVGYCVSNMTDTLMHYAYPFYTLEKEMPNMGMGMILKAMDLAMERNLTNFYLGTVYTDTSLYKAQFSGFKWFTGYKWSDDLPALKGIIRDGQESNNFKESDAKDSIMAESILSVDL